MSDVFQAKEKLLQKLGWEENPFVKDLRTFDPARFMKYYCPFEAEQILQRLAFDAKACLLLGPKGVGKTSALTFVKYSLPEKEFTTVLFKEPPTTLSALATEANLSPSSGFLGGFLSILSKKKEITRAELANKIKAIPKKVVFLFDEAHLEHAKLMYMEFKYLLDEAPNLRMVFSALGKDGFPDSLLQLIGASNIFSRNNFAANEMLRIIEHRINAVGGKGTDPFDSDFLDSVLTEHNLLTPRYVFDELNNKLAQVALGEKEGDADSEKSPYSGDAIVESAIARSKKMNEELGASKGEKITTAHAEWWVLLSPSQQSIMELILRNSGGMTLHEIMTSLSLSQNTAFNALYQLRGDDDAEVKRKPEVPFPLVEVKQKLVGGRKKNIYFVSPKVKTLFTLH